MTCEENDLEISDIVAMTDAFYIGGTKNGALIGEALVIANPLMKENFRYMIKNRGAMLVKGFVAGIQFEELFRDGLFFEMASHENQMAAVLRKGIEELISLLFRLAHQSAVPDPAQSYDRGTGKGI